MINKNIFLKKISCLSRQSFIPQMTFNSMVLECSWHLWSLFCSTGSVSLLRNNIKQFSYCLKWPSTFQQISRAGQGLSSPAAVQLWEERLSREAIEWHWRLAHQRSSHWTGERRDKKTKDKKTTNWLVLTKLLRWKWIDCLLKG